MASSDDSNAIDRRWENHYAEASRRRRERGWHRRDDGPRRGRNTHGAIYAIAGAFLLVVAALIIWK
jgi:hypothetical protein